MPWDAPKYNAGHSINIAAQGIAALISVAGIFYIKWENKKRERGGRDYRTEGLTEEEIGKLGYRAPGFRYME
jgi:hypothetical protein